MAKARHVQKEGSRTPVTAVQLQTVSCPAVKASGWMDGSRGIFMPGAVKTERRGRVFPG